MVRHALAAVLLLAPLLAAADVDRGRETLVQATDALFDNSLPAGELRRLLESSRQAFAGVADPGERAYWQARTEYLSGFVERGEHQEKEAERRFRTGLSLAERAASAQQGDAFRLQADLIAQLITSHGALYAMKNGPRIRPLAEKSLALDPDNAKARLTLALFFLNAPAVGGGSDKEALRILHELERRTDLEREDRFGVLTWLGLAYKGRKDLERARTYLREAQAVYPGNTWVGSLAD